MEEGTAEKVLPHVSDSCPAAVISSLYILFSPHRSPVCIFFCKWRSRHGEIKYLAQSQN